MKRICLDMFSFIEDVASSIIFSPNIYKEGRKTTLPYCSHGRFCVCSFRLEEFDAGAGVGFSPWSTILFPVVSQYYEI